jgi:hypothetical protein
MLFADDSFHAHLQRWGVAEAFVATLGGACAVGAVATFALGLQLRKMNN